MSNLHELLERVEKATGADRELDGEIAAALRVGDKLPDWAKNWAGEWRPTIQGSVVLMEESGSPGPHFSSSSYTASIDAALALVERKLPGWAYAIIHEEGRGNVAYVHNNQSAFEGWTTRPNPNRRWHEVRAATPALAILAALVSALIAKETEAT